MYGPSLLHLILCRFWQHIRALLAGILTNTGGTTDLQESWGVPHALRSRQPCGTSVLFKTRAPQNDHTLESPPVSDFRGCQAIWRFLDLAIAFLMHTLCNTYQYPAYPFDFANGRRCTCEHAFSAWVVAHA